MVVPTRVRRMLSEGFVHGHSLLVSNVEERTV